LQHCSVVRYRKHSCVSQWQLCLNGFGLLAMNKAAFLSLLSSFSLSLSVLLLIRHDWQQPNGQQQQLPQKLDTGGCGFSFPVITPHEYRERTRRQIC